MYCSKCGNELPKNDNFCSNCNERVWAKTFRSKADENKQKVIAWIFLIGIITIGIFLVKGIFSPRPTNNSAKTIEIHASVRFTGAQFVITNNDNFDWTNVKFEVNSGFLGGGYVLETPIIAAQNTYTVGALQFAKDDGTRLNPFAVKPQNIFISCETPQGKAFYSGGW